MVQMNLEHAAAISNRSSAFVIPQERKEVLLQNTCRKRGNIFFFAQRTGTTGPITGRWYKLQ